MRKKLLLLAFLLYLACLFWFVPPSKGQPAPPVSQRIAFVLVDPVGACVMWPAANADPLEYNMLDNSLFGCSNSVWTVIGVGGGGGGGTGTANTIVKFITASTIGNSSVQDDGVTVRNSENVSLGLNALLTAYPNSASGTSPFTLTKLDNSSNAIQTLTTDTTGVYGICAVGCAAAATSATALIAVGGQVQCFFDNQTTIRDFVVPSTSVAGDCSDAGSSEPTGIQVIGRVVNLNSGSGTTATIEIFSPDTAQNTIPVKIFSLPNANPGTVLNEIVTLTLSNPVTATAPGTAATGGMIGVCSTGCGNSGTATIIQAGAALCVVDGATTAGDYLQASTTNAGQFHDAGATYPVPNQVLGRVESTNASGGTYACLIFPPESSNPATATIAAGATNDIVKYTSANAIGPSGCTIDSSNNQVCPGYVQTGTANAYSGEILMSGKTSGSQGIGVLDAAGSAILYLLPTTPTTSSFMQDSGVVTCPTLAPGSPTVCHQLAWATPAGTGVSSFSAGNLSPLFTTSVATPTTTPALSFSLTNAAGGTVFGNNTASSGAPVYTAAPVHGVDNSVAGSLQLANGSAAAHTIFTSAATTSNTIAFPAVVPANGDLVACNTSSTTCTLTAVGPGTTTTVLHGNAAGQPSYGSVVAGDIGANAVGNAALAVVQTRRACIFDNDTQSSQVLVAANFSGHCVVPYAATIVEVDVSGGTQTLTGSATAPTFTGTSSIQIGKHGVTNNTALLSAALATVSGVACALTSTSGTCIFDNGLTSSNSVTISTTSISAGDELYVSAATADGTQTWYNVTIVFTVN